MSADLFAEFEPFSKPTQQSQQPPQPKASVSRPSQPAAPAASLPSFQFGGFGATAASGSLTAPTQPINQQSSQWLNYQQPSAVAGWTPSPGPNAAQSPFPDLNDEDDDEAWGDFEVAQPVAPAPAPVVPQSNAAIGTRPQVTSFAQNSTPMRTRIVRASTIDLLSNNLVDLPESLKPAEDSKRTPWTAKSSVSNNRVLNRASVPVPPKPKEPTSAELLFDADDFDGEQQEDDDDFGDFETVQTVQSPPDLLSPIHPSSGQTSVVGGASQLLSGLNLGGPPSPYPQAPRSPSFHERNPFPGLALNTPPPPQKMEKEPEGKAKMTPITAWPRIDDNSAGSNAPEDDWGSFEDFPVEKEQPVAKPVSKNPPAAQKPAVSSDIDSTWDWDPADTKADVELEAPKDDLPPTNIPPPSILLSIFPELFKEANETLYKPVSGQSFSIKKRILSDPKTIEFLKGYLTLTVVGARIIAGRRLRWHRDKFLSQRMSISAAGSKGMKLASVDKAETAREDREAADVVATWSEHVGRLRSAVAAANSSLKTAAEHLKTPEIKEAMQVQTAKGVPTAPKACLVCGLKRDERIAKVDYEVEDSFGEWWTDHWGHTTCKRFWLQHETILRQR
ncbi:hypothetical protein SLS62_008204 [Diatrype stigma]|uniref:Uncharacterized protein n=1 Tax=Diatrype stigma TaxID=117547 RepID=A0AAN9UM11_9PEZI